MNLANKITISRLILTGIIIGILLFPFDAAGIVTPKLFVNESIVVDVKYLVAGVLFIIASLTDFLDGYVARKYNMITDFGKMMDSIADKVLVNAILVILAASGFISVIIPVILIVRDEVVNSLKMSASAKGEVVAAIFSGKLKTACLMLGITLTLFYNLPFELMNLRVSDALLVVACILAIVSAWKYYTLLKKYVSEEEKKEKKEVKIKKEVKENDELLEKLKEIEKLKKDDQAEKIEII